MKIEPSNIDSHLSNGWLLVIISSLVLTVAPVKIFAQIPPTQQRMLRTFETYQLPSSTPPPVIPPLSLSNTQTLSQYRVATFKEFIKKASQPQYRAIGDQMYDLQALTEFLNWVSVLPVTPENTAMLKKATRPLPSWSLLYGRVAQVTDNNGILMWQYNAPEMVETPKLVRLKNYPLQSTLVDGAVVVVFAKIEPPYSYLDSQHSKSTVSSFDFGKPVTKQEVDKFIQNRPLPEIKLPAKTNAPSFKLKH